ncbi:MAG: hypothetical protein RIR49_194 [Actinomycetota bacterium]
MDPADPVDSLRAALRATVHGWLVRSVTTVVAAQGLDRDAALAAATTMADDAAPRVLAEVDALLLADVDEQRENPLALLRRHLDGPTAVLDALGARAVPRDEMQRSIHPDDHYAIAPATWTDVDESLREPGLVWGAWKAATVLARRRSDGLR